jgi:hypothetical protein
MKSRRIGWAEQVACMGEMMNAYKILVRKLEERTLLEDLVIDRRMISK